MNSIMRRARFPILILMGLVLVANTRPTARTFYDEGQKAFAAGDYRVALERYTQALEKNRSFLQAHLALGATYARLGEWERSRHSYQAALLIEEQHLDALLGLARASIGLSERSAAQEALERARKLDPGSDRVILLDAELALAAGRPAIARRHYERILRSNPGHADALRGAATAAARVGDFEDAARYARRAQLVDPVNPSVHAIQGQVRLQEALDLPAGTRRDAALEAAHESLRTALQLRPDDIQLERQLIWLELYQGNILAAAERARRVVAGSVGVSRQQYLPAFVLSGGSPADLSEAVQLFVELLESTPDDSLVRFRLEQLVLEAKEAHSAGSALRAMLGRYHRERFGHYDERQLADRRDFHLERALELGVSDESTLRRKLELARLRGDFKGFVDLLGQLVALEPANASLRYRLDNALRRRSQDLEHATVSTLGPVGREAAGIFVFDLKSDLAMPYHPDGGQILAGALRRHIQGQGRIRLLPAALREQARSEAGLVAQNRETGEGLTFTPARLTRLVGAASMRGAIDFVVAGSYTSDARRVSATYEVYDVSNGRRMARFQLEGSGRDAIHEISARAARQVAGLAAARATVRGFRDGGLLLNAGTRDGLSVGARLLVYRALVNDPPPVETEMQAKLLRRIKEPLYCKVERVSNGVALCRSESETEERFHRGDRAVLVPAPPKAG